MRSITQLILSLLVAVCLSGFVGCQDSGGTKVANTDTAHDDDHGHDEDDHEHGDEDHDGHDHDDHKHADNYDDAVAELVEMHAMIKDGFASGELSEDAHDPLHEVAHVLENIEKLVEKSEMDDDVKKSLGQAIDDLFGAYGAVDDKHHDLEGKDYDEVSEQIEVSIKTLQAQVSVKEEE